MALSVTINATGDTMGDIELAIDEAKRLIASGMTSGGDRNESGSFQIDVTGEEEPRCISCGEDPLTSDPLTACRACQKAWTHDYCFACAHELTAQDIEGGRCNRCGSRIDAMHPGDEVPESAGSARDEAVS
jgi:hypothetical protein